MERCRHGVSAWVDGACITSGLRGSRKLGNGWSLLVYTWAFGGYGTRSYSSRASLGFLPSFGSERVYMYGETRCIHDQRSGMSQIPTKLLVKLCHTLKVVRSLLKRVPRGKQDVPER